MKVRSSFTILRLVALQAVLNRVCRLCGRSRLRRFVGSVFVGAGARGAPRRVELVDRVRLGSFEKFDKYKRVMPS